MKIYCCIVVLLFADLAIAQKQSVNYDSIDWDVMRIEASSPSELAKKLTAKYQTDLEQTRAIFSWIAQHISYNYKFYGLRRSAKSTLSNIDYEVDTLESLKPLNELVAEDVMKKRTAFCYGYARLFKCLCDYAGIPCEIINGYARGDFNRTGSNFRTNHTWNAVKLDSSWYLVDVTWASGYFSYGGNEFIKRFDDKYFFTAPDVFAQDHFPDDLEWSLLQKPPTIREFQHSPYKAKSFAKYSITSYFPADGIIQAVIGDTINLQVRTDLAADRKIGGGSLDDSSILGPLPEAAFCRPMSNSDNVVKYEYIVQSPREQWLQLVYNDDMILRYKLEIREKKLKK